MCAHHGVGMLFSSQGDVFWTYSATCESHTHVWVIRTCPWVFETQLWRKDICRKGTLCNSELQILLCYWDECLVLESTIQEFVWVHQVRDSKYFCWKINKFVKWWICLKNYAMQCCCCFPHKSNWVVSGALLWVSSWSNSSAQSFVAVRKFHYI